MKSRDVLAIFNRGRISRHAIARTDVARVALSSEVQTNWMPRTLGSMMLRPGLEYLGENAGDGAYLPFIYTNDDVAILELSGGALRVWDGGDTLVTRPTVTALVANGNFTSDLASWTSADETGTASTWVAGQLQLVGTGYKSAIRRQLVTVASNEIGFVHALRIVVTRGTVLLRIGLTAGADDIFRQAVLRVGTHSIAFIPGASFYIEFSSSLTYPALIDSCTIEAAGAMSLPTPWVDSDTCKQVRWQQSADVIFCACTGLQQHRIERRPGGSWSVVVYETKDGPFLTENTENILLTPSAISGSITLTSSRPLFEADHVGALFRLSSQGQFVTANLVASSTFTNEIRVTGVTNGRIFNVVRSGTWAGTLVLQRSIGEPGSWVTVASYTTNGSTAYDDGLDNSIAYYRFGFDVGGYTSGTAVASLAYNVGSITGVVRITAFSTELSVSANVITALGGTDPTEIWAEGEWSDKQGWPSAVTIWGGRIWWMGNGKNYGSVSDAFTLFDPDTEGDSGPINRRVGDGVVSRVNWALPLQRLIAGTDGAEYSIRSSSLDEPVTPTNYNSKSPSTKGSAQVPAVMVDGSGYFVGRTEEAIFEIRYDAAAYDFTTTQVTLLVPEIGEAGFVRLAVQQMPDLRIHAVRGDGTVGVMIRDETESVLCWVDVETDGFVEDVVVLPGLVEDQVFYRVLRNIGGVDVRYHERWALERECRGGSMSKLADSFITGAGAVAGLDHLEGETVVVWGDGADLGSHVVVGGAVALTATEWCAGLPYEARYQSAKLAGETPLGLTLTQRSRIDGIGLILADTHYQGLQYGPDFDTMDDLPMIEDGIETPEGTVWESYDKDMVEFPGDWGTDNRICLKAVAPRPCTVLAAVLSIDRQDKA